MVLLLSAALLCGYPQKLSGAQAATQKPAAETPSAAAERGIRLGMRGYCDQALPLLRKSMPRITDMHLLYDTAMATAQCGMAVDQVDAVVEALALLHRKFPGDTKALYIMTRDFSELANRMAHELLSTAPDSAEAMGLLAESYQAQGKLEEATNKYHMILEKYPNQPNIHYQLARILMAKPLDPVTAEAAKKELEEELKVNPTSPAAEFMMGDIAWREQKIDEAIEHFTRATQFDASLAEPYLGLGIALNAAGKYADAIKSLSKYVEMEPTNPAGYYQLGLAYNRIGNKQEAARMMTLQQEAQKKWNQGPTTSMDMQQPH
jgi:tetratricopeptide (TPR) repeat protein